MNVSKRLGRVFTNQRSNDVIVAVLIGLSTANFMMTVGGMSIDHLIHPIGYPGPGNDFYWRQMLSMTLVWVITLIFGMLISLLAKDEKRGS